jgi:hypothetical protein
MKLTEDVQNFVRVCETLISNVMRGSRTLTPDEGRIVEFYCKELVEKVVPETVRTID